MLPPLVSARTLPSTRPTRIGPPEVPRSKSARPPSTVIAPPDVSTLTLAVRSPRTVIGPPLVSRSSRRRQGRSGSPRSCTLGSPRRQRGCSPRPAGHERHGLCPAGPPRRRSPGGSGPPERRWRRSRTRCSSVSCIDRPGPVSTVMGPPEILTDHQGIGRDRERALEAALNLGRAGKRRPVSEAERESDDNKAEWSRHTLLRWWLCSERLSGCLQHRSFTSRARTYSSENPCLRPFSCDFVPGDVVISAISQPASAASASRR